eukprot:TRINITY_DN4311_c0_g1_i1.p1 TRINITY_DN4311_c0_g1~~TRINITY_DN4311_c0_g1_i1.p1  ORF type:complete len:256 (+),score=54.03 TRINITY_DN4311_c0_g1_i1:1398-2165(+)
MEQIGVVRSAFKDRRGVPRQGTLIGLSKAKLQFSPHIHPHLSLQGLSDYSHLWVIVHLHQNSNLNKEAQKKSLKPFIEAPRLQGAKTGVYSTRSPHRHNSIGLSLARIVHVDPAKREIFVSELDFVDGTPILDIKPYIPAYDCPPDKQIRVPEWVEDHSLLRYSSVLIPDEIVQAVAAIPVSKFEFYDSHDQVLQVIKQVLINDLRPPSKRKNQKSTEIFEVRIDVLSVKFIVDVDTQVAKVIAVDLEGAEFSRG